MIQQIDQLCVQADGRYATDDELLFFQRYLKTARLRFALYQKLQKLEPQIIDKVLFELKTKEPDLLIINGQDLTAKWQRDTVRLIRYAATAVLTDDEVVFKEKLLIWFQTIMQSFKAERSCEATYRAMQKVLKNLLTADEAALFCPLIELTRVTLGPTRV
ncbi:phycobilisome protein [Leptolyngbya iicbica]|uniref:Phycobilisome protein n=2 Tax=Cyanophyceae TaxID=3028117 RepID=A0A4Q7E2N2_9CYAN|nr:phycobilisome protein [Leptolyngbya sp. LK]RZM75646.1 phycobilisome protein [Leptolyngbya sp. LK]